MPRAGIGISKLSCFSSAELICSAQASTPPQPQPSQDFTPMARHKHAIGYWRWSPCSLGSRAFHYILEKLRQSFLINIGDKSEGIFTSTSNLRRKIPIAQFEQLKRMFSEIYTGPWPPPPTPPRLLWGAYFETFMSLISLAWLFADKKEYQEIQQKER